MKMNILVCFVGIDGSGKTTLAKALAAVMKEKGIKCKYVYNQFNPVISKPFMLLGKTIFLHKKDVFNNYSDYFNAKRKLFKNNILSRIYKYFILLDYFIQVLFRVCIPLLLNRNIICDRYIHDVLINLAVDLNYSNDKIVNLLKNCLHFLPKPDLVFLIDVPEGIGMERKNDVPSIDYLRRRRKIYLDVGRECGSVILDGTKSLEDLKNLIQKEVFGKVKIKC